MDESLVSYAYIPLEEQAETLGEDKEALLARLIEAKNVLKKEYRRLFTNKSRFDFVNKRMYSECGRYALQWLIRRYPDKPEGYFNQQTSRGTVVLIEI